MIDIHSHVLHRFDDGPATLDKSIELLKCMEKSGITRAVASSHFYSERMSAGEFADRRNRRIEELREAIKKNNINIDIIPGAEVHIDKLILNADSLKELCIGDTNNILLEIPHDATDLGEQLGLIEKIIAYYNVKPVIAHVERYGFFFRKIKNLMYLKDMGCVVQADALCFLSGFFSRRFGINAINYGLIDVIGSDCHDIGLRKPNLAEAYAVVEKKLGLEYVKRLKNNALMLTKK